MKLNLKYVEGKWFDFKEAKVKIKMFPNSKVLSLNMEELSFEDLSIILNECVVDWKGFVDEDGKEIKCNNKNKKLMVDVYMDLVNFVIEKQNEMREQFDKSLKN